MHGFSQALIIRVCWLVMKRSRWEGLSAVWNGNVFLCFCSGLPRSGEPQNDICKVELQFSLSLSIHTYMHIYLYMFFMPIIRYTVYVYIYIYTYTYPMTCIPHSPSTFDGPSLELDLKKKWHVSMVGKVIRTISKDLIKLIPNSTPSHRKYPSSMWKASIFIASVFFGQELSCIS